jgi:dTDP-4-amino-4,6-dideoxygalactose transaminase
MTEVTTAHTGEIKPSLAIYGGRKVREAPMPPRLAIGENERAMVQKVLDYYAARKVDPGYEGVFEKQYTSLFSRMMGGGYTDAVSTGTAALFISIAALELPKGSEVLVSPITDPGTLSAIILNGLTPRLVDTKPDEFVVGRQQFDERIGPNVRASKLLTIAE